MRNIIFRAKGRDGEGWQEGYYWRTNETTYCFKEDYERNPDNTKHYILFDRMTDWGLPNHKYRMDIEPETLFQYTGLTDKNGRKLWEHDIVQAWSEGSCAVGEVRRRIDGLWIIFPAWQGNEFWGLCPNDKGKTTVEVIGNIFDNPDLLYQQN